MGISVNVTDNSDEVLKELNSKIQLALSAIGEVAEGYAKEGCPVDTGRLRNSISYATANGHFNSDIAMESGDDTPHSTPPEGVLYIGTNVEYAPYVEYKSMRHVTGDAHFLRNAATDHGDEYKKLAEDILKSSG